ncbi:hypothetical protein [Arenicella xantha]|uniref:Uncharacterized protein n=1 Tax=Arenicella xantha TaxID=644221 RepID=A0A395JJN2_9GAMM|nr:hypothetical protein [Arenicella xantha]RBP50993.1 hypothetical protein DFR28_102410 [Arenicella xantha]
MQIVYISNRPKTLNQTLKKVCANMPYIDSALVCMPEALLKSVVAPAELKITLTPEESLLNKLERSQLSSLDHQRRNYLLRKSLIASELVQHRFIMSDDDARPLRLVKLDYFLSANRYQRYYFHDLMTWPNSRTEFDTGQLMTGALLSSLGLPTLSYASHMPQLVDRQIYLEACHFFEPYSIEFALCEWSSYFNYAAVKHPDLFDSPRPYLTLCWPEHPLAWTPLVRPDEYIFENYTPSLYTLNGPFSEESLAMTETISDVESRKTIEATKKVLAWRLYDIGLRYPEQNTGFKKYLNPRTWINKLLTRYSIHQ